MKEWRRKYPRLKCYFPPPFSIPILMHFSNAYKREDGWGVIADISLGGIRVRTRSSVKLGEIIYLSFTISDNFTFANTKGIVRRVVTEGIYYTCGIEFESLVDRQHLEDALNFIADNQPAEKDK